MDEENKRVFGNKGEDIAAKYLAENGYRILDRNFQVGRMGELDIIARENEVLCFIEVKTRKSLKYGMPSEAVNLRKQRTIKMLANIYISRKNYKDIDVRFDVCEILMIKGQGCSINLIKNAFGM